MKNKKIILITLFIFFLQIFIYVANADSCQEKAFKLLKQKDDVEYAVVTAIKNANKIDEFTQMFSCDSHDYGLPTVVHEMVHIYDNLIMWDDAEHKYSYYLTSGEIYKIKNWTYAGKGLFPRSEIGKYLTTGEKKAEYFKTYFVGDIGKEDLVYLLDEFNAYIHTLKVALLFVDLMPQGVVIGERDGLVSFMYYLEKYLQVARTEHSSDWDKITTDDYLDLISALWGEAEKYLSLSMPYKNLGSGDTEIILKLYKTENISELEKTFEKGGRKFTYSKGVLALTKKNNQDEATSSEDEGVKVIVAGEEMSWEEFIKYLKQHPELKNDLGVQEICK